MSAFNVGKTSQFGDWSIECEARIKAQCADPIRQFAKCQQFLWDSRVESRSTLFQDAKPASSIVARPVPYQSECENHFFRAARCLAEEVFTSYPEYEQLCKREFATMLRQPSWGGVDDDESKKSRRKVLEVWRNCANKKFREPMERALQSYENLK